jgi:hypothetical protein
MVHCTLEKELGFILSLKFQTDSCVLRIRFWRDKMNKVLLLFITLSVFVPQQLSAQFTYMVDQSIPVQINEQTLSMPWGGGLNAVQYNTIDLNGDGLEDE